MEKEIRVHSQNKVLEAGNEFCIYRNGGEKLVVATVIEVFKRTRDDGKIYYEYEYQIKDECECGNSYSYGKSDECEIIFFKSQPVSTK